MDYQDGTDYLRYFENVRTRTERVIDSIPAEQLDWRPADGMFSFADLIRHLGATERWMFGENVQSQPSRYPGHGPELADGYPEVRNYLKTMHAQTVQIIQQLSAEDLAKRCVTPGGSPLPVWKWLRSMIEHEVHHRGQIYLMLRLLNVTTPPLYGLTSEEVKANSIN